VILVGFWESLGGGFLRHPLSGGAGDDLGADSRWPRVDTRDGIAPDPIAMGYELVPAYIAADSAGQATLAATADTFASPALVTNAAGNFLGWGVVVPLYTVAVLITRALPRWIGWLGLLDGVLTGLLGLLSPASSVIAGISTIGFISFVVFMLSMGIALLRRRSKVDEAIPASAQGLTSPNRMDTRLSWPIGCGASSFIARAFQCSKPESFWTPHSQAVATSVLASDSMA
jgi:hypothetical protein